MTIQCEDVTSFVAETRIGFWFLGTETWARHVVRVALNDLEPLIPKRKSSYPIVLDAGAAKVSPSVY